MQKTQSKIILRTLPLAIFFLSSCVSQEEIRRRKLVEHLSVEMVESKRNLGQNRELVSSITSQFEELRGAQRLLEGQLEDLHKHNQDLLNEKEQIHNKIFELEKKVDTQDKSLALLKNTVDRQKRYVSKVNKTLGQLAKVKTPTAQGSYKTGVALYRKRQYKKAKGYLLEALDLGIKGKSRHHTLHNLGLILFMESKFEDAIIYLSKSYSKNPKNPYAPNTLLYLGKSFQSLGQKDQAKQAFSELIKNFPGKKQANQAKSALKTI